MSTAVIEIKNDLAYDFLYNLERMDVLRVVSRHVVPEYFVVLRGKIK